MNTSQPSGTWKGWRYLLSMQEVRRVVEGGQAGEAGKWEEYLRWLPKDQEGTIPHEVVGLVIKKGMNLVGAWRTHLGLTQKEVAGRAGITQAALSQMEKSSNELRTTTLEKLARAMGISVEQLRD